VKLHIFRALSVILLGAAAGLTPVSAQAQTWKGSFELPYDVTWNGYNFSAGQYQIWTDAELSGAPFIHLRGPGGVATLAYTGHNTTAETAPPALRLKEVGGAWTVSEFTTGGSGRLFVFRTPRPRHAVIASTEVAAPRETLIRIASAR
jgi:hypothetical protein